MCGATLSVLPLSFYRTLDELKKASVFGKVTKGLDILRKMEGLGSGSGKTSMEVKVSSCGKL